MREVKLASGITIKVPKTEVDRAKNTGTIKTANGLTIKVGKQEIERAEAKKGGVIMTSSGIPIKVTPSGALHVIQQTTNATSFESPKPKYVFKPNVSQPANTSVPKASGPAATPKRPVTTNGAVKKTATAPVRKQAAKPAPIPKSLATAKSNKKTTM
jgi:hypothetical protein